MKREDGNNAKKAKTERKKEGKERKRGEKCRKYQPKKW